MTDKHNSSPAKAAPVSSASEMPASRELVEAGKGLLISARLLSCHARNDIIQSAQDTEEPGWLFDYNQDIQTFSVALENAISNTPDGWRFQDRVQPWLVSCFGEDIAADRLERCDRFTEEAMELVQAVGYDRARAHALVDWVFDRETGEPHQEVGGVMVTLAALCIAHKLDLHEDGERELARISTPEMQAKIRAKQLAKPTGSALPVALPHPPETK